MSSPPAPRVAPASSAYTRRRSSFRSHLAPVTRPDPTLSPGCGLRGLPGRTRRRASCYVSCAVHAVSCGVQLYSCVVTADQRRIQGVQLYGVAVRRRFSIRLYCIYHAMVVTQAGGVNDYSTTSSYRIVLIKPVNYPEAQRFATPNPSWDPSLCPADPNEP